MKKIVLIIGMVAGSLCCFAESPSVGRVLEQVNSNNLKLKAQQQSYYAKSLEARVGNSLENPTVGFERLWGKPREEMGQSNEFTIVQPFDFPTAYSARKKLAEAQEQKFGKEYIAERQLVFLQTKMLLIDYVAAEHRCKINSKRREQAQSVLQTATKRFDKGDLSVIDLKNTQVEVLMAVREYDSSIVELESVIARLNSINGGLTLDLTEFQKDTAFETVAETIPRFDITLGSSQLDSYQAQILSSEVIVSQKDLSVSKAASLPKFQLGYKREFVPHQQMDGVMVGMSLPLWGNRHNVKRAQAGVMVAKAQLEEYQIDVQTTVEELYKREANSRKTLDQYNARATEMGGYVDSIVEAYNAGELNMHEYYAELTLVYGVLLGQTELQAEYSKICAQINSVGMREL